MVVNLDLTEKTIDCFNGCAKKGNYEKFVVENQEFIRTLSDNLKKVKFPVEEIISNMVSQNCKFYIDYLTKWNPREPHLVVPGTTLLERYTPRFVNDLKQAISTRNWDKFYSEYYPTADFMISEARNQGVLNFQIEKGSGIFESFHERDFVVDSMQSSTNDGMRVYPRTPLETKKSIEMILKDQLISDIDHRIKLQADNMKKTFQKDWEENVEKFMLEIEDSVGHAIETNEAKKTELENTRKATSTEKKIDKICGELRNEQNDANKRMEDKLNNLIEMFNQTMLKYVVMPTLKTNFITFSTITKSPEPTIETFDQELRNDKISNGTVIENQNVSIAKLESITEANSPDETDQVDREVNERVVDSTRANQEQQVDEHSEVPEQVPHVSGYDSEEKNHQRRLAEQNRFYGEKLKTIKKRRNQLKV
ncbi:hypothetical protein B9Z55_016800 [Caenorhabditis nigoni]|uniref:Uncharacterized protein n=1 Tax=Caenorhabditis nigoni TaxID=1611254 RepID=A0A2G5T6M8_9PELO|nr:hypothetical protein B9Z55_016800 [Caenorhabditis nigoni]